MYNVVVITSSKLIDYQTSAYVLPYSLTHS
jgi:hypothetical protein